MTKRFQARNEDRLYGEELKVLEAAGFDPAGARPDLLGKDVRRIAKPETRASRRGTGTIGRRLAHMAHV